jgi:carboxypeptidase Q
VMEREDAQRALRLLRGGKSLTLTAQIDLLSGGPFESFNVIGEIRGRERPDEVVLIGAHLDSWDLGTGALDNGCNVAMVLDVARQIRASGLPPRRTIRFALWNGEEQGMLGSWAYARAHAAELDRHVMAASFDIGSGRIVGFFTNGRKEAVAAVEQALLPVAGLGPFTHVDEPVVGTDNLDFMLEGVLNLVANQEPANYGPNYHAASDTFDKVDQRQLRVNAAVTAAVTWGFAQAEAGWKRQSRAEVEALVEGTSLKSQLESFGLYELWRSGARGRRRQ